MDHFENIPSLADLALEYGTITQDQHAYLVDLIHSKNKENSQTTYEELLLDEKIVTRYQIELLKLIQDYHIIRQSGEAFGKRAVEKGFANADDITHALKIQKRAFKKSRNRKLIGDILVETHVITLKQKGAVLDEQAFIARRSREICKDKRPGEKSDTSDIKKPNGSFSTERQGLQKDETAGEKTEKLSISVSPDKMCAWIDVGNTEKEENSFIQVKDLISALGLVNGVYPDSIIQCFLEAGYSKFPIACVDCSDKLQKLNGYISYIDGAEAKPAEIRKGQILTEQTNTGLGVRAENVYGQAVYSASVYDFIVQCGGNTRFSKDGLKIKAKKTGVPSVSVDRKVYIHPVINVLEDADFRYGPVEPYANLSVSGTITGAYPIMAGSVKANEIRGGRLEAIGDLFSEVGITDATIRVQGDVHARYVHNSRIEAFGSVYIENEIIDSQIKCSGKLDCPRCRVISSEIYAKKGVVLAGAGSQRTASCSILAGGAHHVVGLAGAILDEIDGIMAGIESLKNDRQDLEFKAEKIFQKMIELKKFHDNAKAKKNRLSSEFEKNKDLPDKAILAKTQKLITAYDKRMNSSLGHLKALNDTKKEQDIAIKALDSKIVLSTEKAKKEIFLLERQLFAYIEAGRQDDGLPLIQIKGTVSSGTRLGGIFNQISISEEKKSIQAEERSDQEENLAIKISKL